MYILVLYIIIAELLNKLNDFAIIIFDHYLLNKI